MSAFGTLWQKIRSEIGKSTRSAFLGNILTVFTGSAAAQLITVFSAPIVTRIYHPTDYDTLGLFMMATSIISPLVTLEFHGAILVSKEKETAIGVMKLSMIICCAISIASLLIPVFFYKAFESFFHVTSFRKWLFLLPVSVFLGGYNTVFGAWLNRNSQFKAISENRIVLALLTPMLSIGVGLAVSGPLGLMIGLVCSNLIAAILITYRVGNGIFQMLYKANTVGLWRQFSSFPKYMLASNFFNIITNQLPIMILSSIPNVAKGAVGSYNLANRMLGMPSQVLAGSVSEVYRQRVSADLNTTGDCRKLFRRTFALLLALGFAPMAIVFFFGPSLFSFFFGSAWVEAGKYAVIMAPFFLFKFVVSPLSYTIIAAMRLKVSLYIDILLLSALLIMYLVAKSGSFNEERILILYSVIYSSIYLLTLYFSYRYARK